MGAKYVECSWHCLTKFLTGPYFPAEDALIRSDMPADARLVHLESDPRKRTARLFFESDEFAAVEEGDSVPEFMVILTATRASEGPWRTW